MSPTWPKVNIVKGTFRGESRGGIWIIKAAQISQFNQINNSKAADSAGVPGVAELVALLHHSLCREQKKEFGFGFPIQINLYYWHFSLSGLSLRLWALLIPSNRGLLIRLNHSQFGWYSPTKCMNVLWAFTPRHWVSCTLANAASQSSLNFLPVYLAYCALWTWVDVK